MKVDPFQPSKAGLSGQPHSRGAMKVDPFQPSKAGGRRRIRTYTLRQGRMSASRQQSYEELLPRYAIPFSPKVRNFASFFPKKQNLILEIGFGMGRASMELAAENPQNNYLGIEVHTPGVASVLNQIDKRKLQNFRLVQHDAVEVLRDMVADETFHGVHIFFPDPWQKKRHFKRRLIQQDFLQILCSRMVAGGYVYVVTDWDDYASWMLEHFAAVAALEKQCDGHPHRPLTAFEQKGLQQGHRIHELYYRKRRTATQP